MTAQTEEFLLLDGTYQSMQCLPLEGYLEERNIDPRQFTEGLSTALWRGYQGLWEIAHGRLYLIGLLDAFEKPIDPHFVFPDRSLPIAADWFSGRIDVGEGEILMYTHMGWGNRYSTRLSLYVKHGRVVARRRYDQARLLRRRFDRWAQEDPEWIEGLRAQASTGRSPLTWLTPAGIKALGRPELATTDLAFDTSLDPTDQETTEWAESLLRHCTRVPADAPPEA
jgi:hypothetical protein